MIIFLFTRVTFDSPWLMCHWTHFIGKHRPTCTVWDSILNVVFQEAYMFLKNKLTKSIQCCSLYLNKMIMIFEISKTQIYMGSYYILIWNKEYKSSHIHPLFDEIIKNKIHWPSTTHSSTHRYQNQIHLHYC